MTASARAALRHAFTLIELVLVLVILAIVATAALNVVDIQVDQTRFETTSQTIQSVSEAIFTEQRESNGTRTRSGFFADMGGLPEAHAEAVPAPLGGPTQVVLTLRELWVRPTIDNGFARTLAPFDFRRATGGSIANSASAGGQPVFGDPEVIVGSGWRGPYFQQPPGADQLSDAWGNRLVSFPDALDTVTFNHLRGDDANADGVDDAVNQPGQQVLGVRSLGRSNTVDNPDPNIVQETYELDVPALTTHINLKRTQLFGTVQGTVLVSANIGTGLQQPSSQTEMDDLAQRVVVQLFHPDSNTGLIRVQRADVSFQRYDDNGTTSSPDDDGSALDTSANGETSEDAGETPGSADSNDPENVDATDDDRLIFSYVFENSDGSPLPIPVGIHSMRAYIDDDAMGFTDSTADNVVRSQVTSLSMSANVVAAPDLFLN